MKPYRLPGRERSLLYTFDGDVRDDSEIANAVIGAGVVVAGASVSLDSCVLNRSTIHHAEGVQFRSCRLLTVDAANADMDRSGWRDCEVNGSRFTGAKLNSANLNRVEFRECRMSLVQLQTGKLRQVRFESCDLRGAYFNGSDLTGTVFEGSDLARADFSGATLNGCDFRRAVIDDVRVASEQLDGVIVTSDQALYLVRLFGLVVQE